MADAPIEPTAYDVVVVGTGLPESIVASSLSKAGKTVLQLDSAPYFGGGWGTLPLDDYVAWIEGKGGSGATDHTPSTTTPPTTIALPPPHAGPPRDAALLRDDAALDAALPPPARRRVFVDRFPSPVYCDGPLVDALVAHGAAPYTEFKLAGATVIGGRPDGDTDPSFRLTRLAASRADVFADRALPLPAKRALMRFLTGAADAVLHGTGPQAGALLSATQPLAAVVARSGLPAAAADAVLYGVAGADVDQAAWSEMGGEAEGGENAATPPPLDPPAEAELAGAPLPWAAAPHAARAGALLLRRHVLSSGRYGGPSPLLAPVHGAGELPQAFVRAAAVAGGGAAALRRRVVGVTVDEDGRATGVVLASGQAVACGALVLPARAAAVVAAAVAPAQPPSSPPPPPVSRAVAILDGCPAGADAGTPIVLPPRCIDGTAPRAAVRGFLAAATTAAAPPGVCLLHVSCPASGRGARADLEPVLAALATLPGGDATTPAPPGRPRALLLAFHTAPAPCDPVNLQTGLPANVAAVPGPGGGAAAADAAVAAAAAVLTRLFGADVPLLPPRPADSGDASDEEAADELEAVLGELGL